MKTTFNISIMNQGLFLRSIEEVRQEYIRNKSYQKVPQVILDNFEKFILQNNDIEKQKYFDFIFYLENQYKNDFEKEFKITASKKNYMWQNILYSFVFAAALTLLCFQINPKLFFFGFIAGSSLFIFTMYYLGYKLSVIRNCGRYPYGKKSFQYYFFKYIPPMSLDEAVDRYVLEQIAKKLKLPKHISLYGWYIANIAINSNNSKEYIKNELISIIGKETKRSIYKSNLTMHSFSFLIDKEKYLGRKLSYTVS